jgi:hypothetical protein
MPMNRKTVFIPILIVWLFACHPIVPSETCKQQMSDCLAKCEADPPEARERDKVMVHTRNSRSVMSTCEKLCMHCGNTKTASPKSAPAPTPTGAPPPIPPDAVSPPQGIDLNPAAPDGGSAAE